MSSASAGPIRVSRADGLRRALRLSVLSVAFGLASGAVSIISGLGNHSLGVFAVGLGVLADVSGSVTLIWRFRAELADPGLAGRRERQSALVVGTALAATAVVLAAGSTVALAQQSRPGSSTVTIAAAGVSLAVLTPLAVAKRRLGTAIASPALRGDAALSGIAAATSLLAIAALAMYQALGWWWADRATALVVAAVAGTESWRTLSHPAADADVQ